MSICDSVQRFLSAEETRAREVSEWPQEVIIHGYESRNVDRKALEEFYEELLGYSVDASKVNQRSPVRDIKEQEGLRDKSDYEVKAMYPEPLPPFTGDLEETDPVEMLEAKAENRLESLTCLADSPEYDVKAMIGTNYPEVKVVDDQVVYPGYSLNRPEVGNVFDDLPEKFQKDMRESEWQIDPGLREKADELDIPYFEVQEEESWRIGGLAQ